VQKDPSLISVVPKWSGSETRTPLEEHVSSIQGSARVGLWQDSDKLQVAVPRLSDVVKQFYNGCVENHSLGETLQQFKSVFKYAFRDTHTDHYHFMRLQTARQRKETPE
jgi:hypothetical protein